MTVLLGNFEPPLERDPRRLSFRFLLSNSSTSPPSAAQCAARLGVRTALDYDLGANGRPSPSGRRRAGDQMGTLLAKNADVVVTMDGQRRELRNAGLFARDGMIENVGPTAELPESADLVLDLRGHILLPGLINCHHHLDQILTRNLPAGQNTNLFPWLKAHYRVWASRTPEDTRTAVLVGCAELARSGCTTVFDHAYVFKNGCKVDDQIAAAAELGIRFAVSRGSMSLGQSKGGLPPDDCVEDESAILKDSIRVIERYHDSAPGSMLQIVLAPCSPFSVTAELMRESAKMARHYGVKLHTHLCETLDEERYTLQHRGLRPVAYMESLDWVGQDVWYATPCTSTTRRSACSRTRAPASAIARRRTCGSRPGSRR